MKRSIVLFLTFLALLVVSQAVLAQTDEFRLNVQKSFGFNNGEQIRGTFRLEVTSTDPKLMDTIQSATFLVDSKVVVTLNAPPFRTDFKTTDFDSGSHNLSAAITTKDGRKVSTALRHFEFVTAEQEGQAMIGIIFPLLGGVALVFVVVFIVQGVVFRRRGGLKLPLGEPRKFGLMGGAVCPRCGRVFGVHMLSVNLIGKKLDRCDFCGKWSAVRPIHDGTKLQAAIQAELAGAQPAQPVPQKSDEEKLKELIDESKYMDGK